MAHLINFARWNQATLEYLRANGGPNNLELLTSAWYQDAAAPYPKAPDFDIFCKAE
jgi:hypothetical protein